MRIIYGRRNSYEEKPKLQRRAIKNKLNFKIAQEIRSRFKKGGVTQKALGVEYKVHPTTISYIISNKNYKV